MPYGYKQYSLAHSINFEHPFARVWTTLSYLIYHMVINTKNVIYSPFIKSIDQILQGELRCERLLPMLVCLYFSHPLLPHSIYGVLPHSIYGVGRNIREMYMVLTKNTESPKMTTCWRPFSFTIHYLDFLSQGTCLYNVIWSLANYPKQNVLLYFPNYSPFFYYFYKY